MHVASRAGGGTGGDGTGGTAVMKGRPLSGWEGRRSKKWCDANEWVLFGCSCRWLLLLSQPQGRAGGRCMHACTHFSGPSLVLLGLPGGNPGTRLGHIGRHTRAAAAAGGCRWQWGRRGGQAGEGREGGSCVSEGTTLQAFPARQQAAAAQGAPPLLSSPAGAAGVAAAAAPSSLPAMLL